MNTPQSTYKTDFVYDWMENNFGSNTDDFCSPENINDCIQYISQEFCAIGYPSIYLTTSSCPYGVNCDIVKLLNVTFELLGINKDHAHVKEELDCRCRRLSADIISLRKKNSLLKENVEHMERKYRSALERERQLKEKNESLSQAMKNEKDEAKKLSSQVQQQKVTYQHEIRKYESNMNQMKARLKQILADKNPDKKIASVSSSSLLKRNSKERGKWITGTVAKSCVEEMYSSLISSYENRCQEMLKDITDYQQCLEYINSEMQEIITHLRDGDKECNRTNISYAMPISMICNGPNKLMELEKRFKSLLCEIKEIASERIKTSLKSYDEEIHLLKSKVSQYEKVLDEYRTSSQVTANHELKLGDLGSVTEGSESQKSAPKLENEKLHQEKLELSATITLIEKEKANLEAQKLEFIKMAVQHESPRSEWHQNLKSTPSFSVITTKDGVISVPAAGQLKHCHSSPNQQLKTLSPLWNASHFETSQECRSADSLLPPSKSDASSTKEIQENFPSSELPKWAASLVDSYAEASQNPIVLSDKISNEELELSIVSSTEEQSLARLKDAIDDIESRKSHSS